MVAFLCIGKKNPQYVRKEDVESVHIEYCTRFDDGERNHGFYVIFCMGSGETFSSQSIYFGDNRENARTMAADCIKHVVEQLVDESSTDMYGLED